MGGQPDSKDVHWGSWRSAQGMASHTVPLHLSRSFTEIPDYPLQKGKIYDNMILYVVNYYIGDYNA